MKKILGIFIATSLLFASAGMVAAQENGKDPVAPAKKEDKPNSKFNSPDLQSIECVGTIQVTPPDAAKKQKYATITIKDGDREFKLIPGKDKKNFAELEKLAGKVVSVSGKLLPANEKFPMPAIKVDTFSEVTAPAAGETGK
jgi:hypothetical protein